MYIQYTLLLVVAIRVNAKNRLNIVLTSKPEEYRAHKEVIFTNNNNIHNSIIKYKIWVTFFDTCV